MPLPDAHSGAKPKVKPSYYAIAVLLPLLLLALLEGLLRLTGLPQQYPLLIAAPEAGYMQLNPHVIRRYFAEPDRAPNVAPDSQYILAEKASASYRIVLMGGSSAAGFPYGRFGSPAAMLQQRLKQQYPAQQFEVINTAMSAINSYSLLDFSDEIITLQPDLVLIYAGHNEYLGIMGVGSAFAASSTRSATLIWLSLRQLALVQFLERAYHAIRPTADPSPTSRTLMASMAAQQHIGYDSAAYHAGLEQFSANMHALLQRFNRAGITVVLSTIAANEADQPPFVSPALPEPIPDTITTLQQALSDSPQHAGLHYALAQQLRRQGQHAQALQHYQYATDYDALRFRAPAAINERIRQLAAQYQLPLAEGQAQLRAQSNNGVIGNSLMLEHLHPNGRGYFLLADAFLQAITPLLPPPQVPVTLEQAWAVQPLHEVDTLLADYKVRLLTADFPFTVPAKKVSFGPQQSAVQQLAYQRSQGLDWLNASEQLLRHYQQQQDGANAAQVAAQLADALPFRADLASLAGQFYFASQQLSLAEYYQRAALHITPDDEQAILLLTRTLYYRQQYQPALALLQRLLQKTPNHPVALRQQRQLQQLLQQENTP
ncbi:SGNH/GDSL hydrolase family protein [Rheinheimera maricola]|uniref:GDSL-type esterase/lipase family protein n=1 Tax=Rheinheimera maricola TaxID=2793282 RepID=A0ABS7XCV5_9GAMM|nr:GDSL-type esterase/lipase family protein [Rheinheimera maricola]MBZ9613383.1 GDSL-type esterase/lipase family protein [Rheinheimera maricola]